jgi:lysylphosphatidylglycerol synthetase-like protein (DUF2156 family)
MTRAADAATRIVLTGSRAVARFRQRLQLTARGMWLLFLAAGAVLAVAVVLAGVVLLVGGRSGK